MPISDHILCFLLATVIHIAGLLLLSQQLAHSHHSETAAATLDVSSVELTLEGVRAEPAASRPQPARSAAPATPQQSKDQPPSADRVPLAPLELPPPTISRPRPLLPRKASFTDLLTPPAPPGAEPDTSTTVTAAAPPAAAIVADGSQGRIDSHPSLERAIRPTYPMGARRRGEEGTVILDVTVDSDGRTTRATVIRSSGFATLDRAAERAVEKARFTPGRRDGQATVSSARLTIIFRLRNP